MQLARRGQSDGSRVASAYRREHAPRPGPSAHPHPRALAPTPRPRRPVAAAAKPTAPPARTRPISGLASTITRARRVAQVRRIGAQHCRDSILGIGELPHFAIDPVFRDVIDQCVGRREVRCQIGQRLVAGTPKIVRPAQCGVERTASGILEAHRHEHAAPGGSGQPQREAIVGANIAARCQPRRAPFDERSLGRSHHRRDAPQHLDLLDQPVRTPIPPRKRGTNVIEADPFQSRQRGAFDTRRPRQEATLLRLQTRR